MDSVIPDFKENTLVFKKLETLFWLKLAAVNASLRLKGIPKQLASPLPKDPYSSPLSSSQQQLTHSSSSCTSQEQHRAGVWLHGRALGQQSVVLGTVRADPLQPEEPSHSAGSPQSTSNLPSGAFTSTPAPSRESSDNHSSSNYIKEAFHISWTVIFH